MNLKNIISWISCLIGSVWLMAVGLISCDQGTEEGMVIFTRIPASHFNIAEGAFLQAYDRAQLMAIDMNDPEGSETILSAGFHAACSPEISYDAEHLLFLAKKEKPDTWQVWEMDLKSGRSRKITDFKESCSGPAYLPGDRLVFSRQMPDEGHGSTLALYTMNLDGTNLNRITFQPHADYSASILRDGRILMLTRQQYPESGKQMYLTMRPNGTKAELFHTAGEGGILGRQAYESLDGFVYFTRRGNGPEHKADLVSVHQNRPLYTLENLSEDLPGSFYSVFPLPSGELLVSYQSQDAATSGLYRFSHENKLSGEPILEYTDYHILEPVLVEAYTRPRHLPDEVNKSEATGQLFCQDINVTAPYAENQQYDKRKAHMIEVLGLEKSMGIVPVEDDGSFYLKVVADTPFRLQTLDARGEVVNGPSGWLWLRPFERRGCVGCHADPELVPKNFVPLAVKKQPVSIPVKDTRPAAPGSSQKQND